jgi:hypothetical protein
VTENALCVDRDLSIIVGSVEFDDNIGDCQEALALPSQSRSKGALGFTRFSILGPRPPGGTRVPSTSASVNWVFIPSRTWKRVIKVRIRDQFSQAWFKNGVWDRCRNGQKGALHNGACPGFETGPIRFVHLPVFLSP